MGQAGAPHATYRFVPLLTAEITITACQRDVTSGDTFAVEKHFVGMWPLKSNSQICLDSVDVKYLTPRYLSPSLCGKASFEVEPRG